MAGSRTKWWILALVSLAALAPSAWVMFDRAAAYYRAAEREQYVFSPVASRGFEYAGRAVALTDVPEPTGAGGVGVAVRYGDEELVLPATIEPGREELPGLVRHEDWLRVLRFVPRGGRTMADLERAIAAGEVRDRIVIVVKRPRSVDSRTGHVWRKEWSFDFYELTPEGGFRVERLHYPTNRAGHEPKAGQLAPGSWQLEAALMLMPAGTRPARSFTDDAIAAMGWTLPAAGVSLLGLTFALAFALSPRGRVSRTASS